MQSITLAFLLLRYWLRKHPTSQDNDAIMYTWPHMITVVFKLVLHQFLDIRI